MASLPASCLQVFSIACVTVISLAGLLMRTATSPCSVQISGAAMMADPKDSAATLGAIVDDIERHHAGAQDDSAIGDSERVRQERHLMPVVNIVANYDAKTLGICSAMLFAPPVMQLAFLPIIDQPIDEHGNRLLHIASRSGNLFALWHLLELGATSDVRNAFGKSPSDVAVRSDVQVNQTVRAALSSPDHSFATLFRRLAPDTGSTATPPTPERNASAG